MGRALVNRNEIFRLLDDHGKYLVLFLNHPEYRECSLAKQYYDDFNSISLDEAIKLVEFYVDKFVEEVELFFEKIENEGNHICKRSDKTRGTEETDLNSPDNGSTEDSK